MPQNGKEVGIVAAGMQLKRPRLIKGHGASRKIYIVTHGRELDGLPLYPTRKYLADEDFEVVARELGWSPPPVREALEHALEGAEEDDEFDRTADIARYRQALEREGA